MSLLTDIKEEIKNRKPTKAEMLLNVGDEIFLMLPNLSLKKQIELLIKNKIVEKISMSEYKKILIKHFGYKPKFTHKTRAATSANSQKENLDKPKPKLQKQKLSSPQDAKEFLSQEINLY